MAATQADTTGAQTQDDLAARVAETFGAEEIRRWMSNNDLVRSRGARKIEAAEQAVEQDPALCEEAARGEFKVQCHCGYVDYRATAEAAVEAARAHKSENNTHFPSAYDPEGEALYGR